MWRARPIILILVLAAIATPYAITRIGAVPEPVVAPQRVAVPRPPGTTLEVTYIAK